MSNNLGYHAPCIISQGTLFNKRDMIRSLDTLETVNFIDNVNGEVFNQGKGTVARVFASKENATLILNGALFINVNSFEYLSFETDDSGKCVFKLFNDTRNLILIPIASPRPASYRPRQGVLFSNDDLLEEEPCVSLMDDWFDDDYDDL